MESSGVSQKVIRSCLPHKMFPGPTCKITATSATFLLSRILSLNNHLNTFHVCHFSFAHGITWKTLASLMQLYHTKMKVIILHVKNLKFKPIQIPEEKNKN